MAFETALANLVEGVEEMAEAIFEHAVATNQPIPSRAFVEAGIKKFTALITEPACEAAKANGTPAAEIDAYAALVASHVKGTFQTKWDEMKRRHVELPVHAEVETIQ